MWPRNSNLLQQNWCGLGKIALHGRWNQELHVLMKLMMICCSTLHCVTAAHFTHHRPDVITDQRSLEYKRPFPRSDQTSLAYLLASHRNLEILQFKFPLYKESDFLWTCIRLLQLRSSNRCYTGCLSLLFKVHAWFHRLSTGRCGPVFVTRDLAHCSALVLV